MPSEQTLPEAAQIAQLPCAVERIVDHIYIDANGHMNVVHHLDFGSAAADALVRGIGIDDTHRAERRPGVFTAEHHLRYYSELVEHDMVDVHARVLDSSARVVHMMSLLVNRSCQQWREHWRSCLFMLISSIAVRRRCLLMSHLVSPST